MSKQFPAVSEDSLNGLRTLLVEGNPDGHRLYYLSLLAAEAAARGDEVIVATTSAATRSREWQIHMTEPGANLQVRVLDEYSVGAISALAQDVDADHTVVPDGDAFVYQIACGQKWAPRGTVSALVMRERGQSASFPGKTVTATIMKALLLQTAHRRPRVQVRVLKSAAWNGVSLLPVSRDPVTLSSPDPMCADYSPALAGGYFWFGVVGNIGPRKNFPLVARTIAAMARADVGLVAAGKMDPATLDQAMPFIERIRKSGGRVEIIDRLLADEEIDQIIVESDCVVLAHSNEGSSGILGKAAAAGTRIVAAGARSLKSDCRRLGSGARWAELTESALGQTLDWAMSVPRPEQRELATPSSFAASLLRTNR